MLDCSWTTNHLRRCVILLCSLLGVTYAAETDLPPGLNDLEEVRTLAKLPGELAKVVGWQGRDEDRIADLERDSAIAGPGPTSFERWFLLAGLSNNYALIAMEERSGYRSADRIHANGFSLTGSDWVAAGEWVLSSRPHTVGELVQLVRSPESQALTARWQRYQRDRDLQRRISESEPTRYRSPASFREIDINDEEIREIEGVVRELIPGAIVMISGVAKGCPCEDGPACAAQVWIAVHLPKQTRSLELSDINDHWVIGPVQQWFLDSGQLQRSKYSTSAEYAAARQALDDRYPICSAPPSSAH